DRERAERERRNFIDSMLGTKHQGSISKNKKFFVVEIEGTKHHWDIDFPPEDRRDGIPVSPVDVVITDYSYDATRDRIHFFCTPADLKKEYAESAASKQEIQNEQLV